MLLTRSMENNWMLRKLCLKMVQTREEEDKARPEMIIGATKVRIVLTSAFPYLAGW